MLGRLHGDDVSGRPGGVLLPAVRTVELVVDGIARHASQSGARQDDRTTTTRALNGDRRLLRQLFHIIIRPDFALVCILIGAAALRVHHLGSESLWLDEAFSVQLANSPLSTVLTETARDVHPPFYYMALGAWVKLAGSSEAGARMLSVLLSLAAIVAVYRLGSLLFGKPTGLLAAFFAGVSPFQIEFAQEARMYALLALLSVLSLFFFVRLLTEGARVRSWLVAAYSVSTALMLYTQAYAVFIIAAELLVLLSLLVRSTPDSRRSLKRGAFGLALAVILFLPWLPTQMAQVFQVQHGFWIPEGTRMSLPDTVALYAGSVPLAWIMSGFAVLGVVAGSLARNRSGTPRRLSMPVAVLWCLCPIALPFLISQVSSPIFMSKYTIAGSLAFSVLAAHGVVAIFGRWGALGAAVMVGLLTWTPLNDYYGTIRKVKWRETTAAIDRAAEPRDLVLLNQSFSDIPFRYYSRRADLVVVPFLKNVPVEDLTTPTIDVLLSVAAAGHDRVWLVLSNPDRLAPLMVRHFENGYSISRHTVEWGLEVYLFAKP